MKPILPERHTDHSENSPWLVRKSLEDYPQAVVDFVLSTPRWSEAKVNSEFARAVKIVEAQKQDSSYA